jgi:hypothetical protein
MPNNEDNEQLIASIISHYEDKKRLLNKHFRTVDTESDKKHFANAASICSELGIDTGTYVRLVYERLGEKKSMFSPAHLSSTSAKHYVKDLRFTENNATVIEITNRNIDPAALWRQQMDLVAVYTKRGESIESVLMDSSLKLFAWFRILSTSTIIPEVANKYRNIAKKEITQEIYDFAKREKLDIDRLS